MFEEINKELLKTHKQNDFLTGGCFLYAKIIIQIYGGEIYINRKLEHCAVKYNNTLYDIEGRIKNTEGFRPLKEKEWKMCEREYVMKNKEKDEELIENIIERFGK